MKQCERGGGSNKSEGSNCHEIRVGQFIDEMG